VHGNIRSLEFLPFGQFAGFNIANCKSICEDSFLFEIADEAMASSRRDEVREEHGVEENALGTENHDLHEPARLGHFEESQKVHALIVSFFEKGLNPRGASVYVVIKVLAKWNSPSVITLEATNAVQMTEHTSYHTRNSCNALQEYEADEPFAFTHLIRFGFSDCIGIAGLQWGFDVMFVSCCDIRSPSKRSHHGKRNPVRPVLRVAMGDSDILSHLLFGESGPESAAEKSVSQITAYIG
jgi:hypothetical protein